MSGLLELISEMICWSKQSESSPLIFLSSRTMENKVSLHNECSVDFKATIDLHLCN